LADHVANLRRLIRSLDLNRLTLVAQVWGGAIGLGALLEERERFERIILFNTGAFPPPFVPWRIRACRWPVLGKLAVQGGNVFSRAALKMTLSRRAKLDPTAAAGYLAPYSSWDRRAAVYQFVRDIPCSVRHPTWQTLERIESRLPSLAEWPIQLIWGMQDWCFTPACLDRLCAAWPAAEVRRLQDVGPWVTEDAPDDALAAISSFLDPTTLERKSSDDCSRQGDPTEAPTEDTTVLSPGSRKPH
jgi:haloalkane dehalogenase